MWRKSIALSPYLLLLLLLLLVYEPLSSAALGSDGPLNLGRLMTKARTRTIASTDYGEILAVDVDDVYGGPYHFQFFALAPDALFLPVVLQTDMVFYVNKGKGRIGWVDDDDFHRMEIQGGDVYGLESGSIFYLQSYADPSMEKLNIFAMFTKGLSENSQETFNGAYANLSELVVGFDKKVLQMAFKVSEDIIDVIKAAEKPPPIIHMKAMRNKNHLNWKAEGIEMFADDGNPEELHNSKRAMNIFRTNRDFNSNSGWSSTINYRNLDALKGSNIGVIMVNLTKGSMMGPHWNPKTTEIAIVTYGQGMVQMIDSSNAAECKDTRFKVQEGDVLIVPPSCPMAHFSFNNDSLVLMGFTIMERDNNAKFLAGKRSVLRRMDVDVLALSFNVSSTTIKQLLSFQRDVVISSCPFCAEEEERIMKEEIEKQREEEEKRRKEEEERKKREEEEARKREEEERKRKEEEERKKQEEEEKKRKEEEERKREEEERKRKEEEERKRQEEERKKKEEEERKRKEEEERKRKEEEERKRREEEEERKRKEEEERKRQEEEEKKRKEEEERKKREEEEAKKREEEEKKRQEEEEKKREEEEERKKEEEKEKGVGGGVVGALWLLMLALILALWFYYGFNSNEGRSINWCEWWRKRHMDTREQANLNINQDLERNVNERQPFLSQVGGVSYIVSDTVASGS